MAYVVKVFILADNTQAVRAIEQTATVAGTASGEITAADERIVAANRGASASFAEMKRGVSLLGTVAFAALGFGMERSVKAAINWQAQQAALQQAMKNTGTYSRQALDNINAGIEHLSTHGGFGEADQLTAITQLIGQTHSLTAAQNLNVAATNLARGAHLDYASAVSKLEAAMIGQTRGISKLIGTVVPVTRYTYGWTAAMKAAYPEQYAQAVIMNKQATAAEILRAVQKRFGDQAAAYSRTIGGAISNLGHAFEIIFRQLGQAVLPAVKGVVGVLGSIGSWMTSHMGVVKELAKNFLAIAGALGAVVVMWKAWNTAIKVQKALAETNPWLLALTAIAILAAEVITHWKQVSGAIVSVFNAIGHAVSVLWDGLKKGFVAVVNFIVGMINKFIIAPLNAVLSLGGLLGGGPIPKIPTIGGGSHPATAPAGGGPNPQTTRSSNSSVPASQHRAGEVTTSSSPVTITLDGRVIAEQVVHHIHKRAALA